jgi:hypothetical protein
MATHDEIIQPYVANIETEGRRYNVSVRVVYDGIEYVGRLWFADEAWEDIGLPDRGALPGRTREEVISSAMRLTPEELVKRHRRALAEKRRFIALRKHTDEILAKIRYLNQLAVSMRAGLLDVEGAAQEVDLTEKQLHSLIDTLSEHAGKEE